MGLLYKNMKKQFLVYCNYDEYCQGYEETWGYFLVTASSFKDAVEKLKKKLVNPDNFRDCNVE